MKQCLIITATIQPNSIMVTQNDVEVRKKEYLDTLKFYLKQSQLPIYFFENSDYDIKNDEDFQTILNQERVSLYRYPKSGEFAKGKGYQEFEVLDQTIPKLIDEYDEFIKVSGRYKVINFKELVAQKNNGILIDRHQKRGVAITSFFRCKMEEYMQFIKGSYQEANDQKGIFIEHIIYQRLKIIPKDNIDLFIKNPFYEGVSGSYGGNLNRHPLKMKIRNMERTLLKWLGIKEFRMEY